MIDFIGVYLTSIFISMMIIAPFIDMEINKGKQFTILKILFIILISPFILIIPIIDNIKNVIKKRDK